MQIKTFSVSMGITENYFTQKLSQDHAAIECSYC